MRVIEYRPATVRDVSKLRGYLDFNSMESVPIVDSTIVAISGDGEVVGCIMANVVDNDIVVGPLLAESKFITVKLVDTMEHYLFELGGVGYVFHVGRSNKEWDYIVNKLATRGTFIEFAHDKSGTWYMRRFSSGGIRSRYEH